MNHYWDLKQQAQFPSRTYRAVAFLKIACILKEINEACRRMH